MTNVKEHYDQHLGNFYSWMAGDFKTKVKEFQAFLKQHRIQPAASRLAIDLGAGHGIQSVALSKAGFTVQAIDFNDQLLNELHHNAEKHDIHVYKDDFRNFRQYGDKNPELIICCGDTLTHLDDAVEVKHLLDDCSAALSEKGKLLLSFRDYTMPLHGNERFIPVKADDKRILTCFLEFSDKKVIVTDILHERTKSGWQQKISSYSKLRLAPPFVTDLLEQNKMTIVLNEKIKGLVTIIAEK